MAIWSTIETTRGKVWCTHFDSGDVALWWPERAVVGSCVVELLGGRAAWKPQNRNWIVPLRYADAVLAEIARL